MRRYTQRNDVIYVNSQGVVVGHKQSWSTTTIITNSMTGDLFADIGARWRRLVGGFKRLTRIKK